MFKVIDRLLTCKLLVFKNKFIVSIIFKYLINMCLKQYSIIFKYLINMCLKQYIRLF